MSTPPLTELPSPGATADQLTQLARQTSVPLREAVARHPNTPARVLGQLAPDFPEAVLQNPALPLLRLAHPGEFGQWSGRTLARLAAVEAAPEWVQDLAMRHPDPQAQWAVANRAQLSSVRLGQLARRSEWALRAAVAQHPDLSPDLALLLARDLDYGVRLALSGRSGLSAEVLGLLQRDPHALVRRRAQVVSTGTRPL